MVEEKAVRRCRRRRMGMEVRKEETWESSGGDCRGEDEEWSRKKSTGRWW